MGNKLLRGLLIKGHSLRTRLRKLAGDSEEEGVWRTVMGRRIFIREGEDVQDAFRRDKKEKPTTHERDTVTKARLKQKLRDGEWEAVSDATRQGFQELRNTKTKKRFTVRITDWTIGGKL